MKIGITKKSVVNFLQFVIICVVWFSIGWIVRGVWNTRWIAQIEPEIYLIEQVRQRLLNEHPLKSLDTRDLTYAAIRGMLRYTEDPYASLLEPPVAARFLDDFAGESGLVGLHLEQEDGQMLVGDVTSGGPADVAGLLPGDIILAVDGVAFNDATTGTEVSLLIRGPVGEAAHFVIQRGEETLEFYPVRQPRENVTSQMLEGSVAHLTLAAFTTSSPQEIESALQDLMARQPRALIWDLRANGGGSMQATQEILSHFIGDGLLFTADLKDGVQERFPARSGGLATEIPMVVLVDAYTYSSGEASAAAISERNRGTLIGETTYGKSTINATYPLIEDCMLQMTIGKCLAPSGKWYHDQGVSPDIFVSDDPATSEDEMLNFALQYVRQELLSE